MIKKITLLFLLCSSFTLFSQVDEEKKVVEIIEITEDKIPEIIPIAIAEQAPIYPGCEEYTSRQELKRCMSQNLRYLVNENFNMELVQTLDIASGHHRIFLSFDINKEGVVENLDVRAPHAKLKEEGERVLKLIPQMKPAKYRGQNVAVRYALPLMIAVEGNEDRNKPKRG